MLKNIGRFFYYYLRSARLYYCFITGASTIAGVAAAKSFCGGEWGASDFVLILFGFAAWGVNQIFSDYFDLKEDAVNAPNRPMVCGKLNARWALALSGGFMVLFALCSYFIAPLALCALAFGAAMNIAYSFLKKVPVLDCLIYALSISSCALYGFFGASGGAKFADIFCLAAQAALIMLPAHFLMCSFSYYKDKRGDSYAGIKTLQVMFDDSRTLPAHFIFALFYSAAVSALPGNIYAFAACFGAEVFLLIRLVKNLRRCDYHFATKLNCQLCAAWLFCVSAKFAAVWAWGVLVSILLIEAIFIWYIDEKE